MNAENQGTGGAAQHFNVGTQNKLKLMHRRWKSRMSMLHFFDRPTIKICFCTQAKICYNTDESF